jgi:hypothetical protein
VNQLTGINLFPAAKHHPIKKRYHAIQIGRDFYIHRKTYKKLVKLSRRGRDLTPLIKKLRTKYSLPALTLTPFGSFGVAP